MEASDLGKVESTIDLKSFDPDHGVIIPGVPLKITTQPEQWSYAAKAKLTLPSTSAPTALRIRATVMRGRIGFGCVTDDFSTFVDEVEVAATRKPETIVLLWSPDQKASALIVRNTAEGGKVSEVWLASVEWLRLASNILGNVPPNINLRPVQNWARYYSSRGSDIKERLRGQWFDKLSMPAVMPWLYDTRVRLHPGNEMLRALYISGCYEPNSMILLSKTLSAGDVFIDVGANIGLFSILASRLVGTKGTVFAIEPSSREAARLRDNIALNGMQNINAVLLALTDAPGQIELSIADDKHGGHNTLSPIFMYNSVERIGVENVPGDTFDNFVNKNNIDRVRLIKIDVEGAELKVIRGARNTLAKSHPILLLEALPKALALQGGSIKELEDELLALDYRFSTIDDQTAECIEISSLTEAKSENVVAWWARAPAP